MRNIRKRLERLEQATAPLTGQVIQIVYVSSFLEGAVIAWRGDNLYIARRPGESEEELSQRASEEARSMTHPNKYVLIHQVREGGERNKPDPDFVSAPTPQSNFERVVDPVPIPTTRPISHRVERREVIEIRNPPEVVSGHWMG